MRAGRTMSVVLLGVRAHPIDIEAVVTPGLPAWNIVGLPDTAVNESRDRIRAAAASSGLSWPNGRITVGLGPASLPKRGSALDLAIAMAVLSANAELPDRQRLHRWMLVGELSLDGTVCAVGSVIPAAITAVQERLDRLVVPAAQGPEASLVDGLEVLPVTSLRHLWAVLHGDAAVIDQEDSPASAPSKPIVATPCAPADLSDVRGQGPAREALVIAAAGGHHLGLVGPAGVGKTLLAERLPSLLPDLEGPAALEATAIRALTEPVAPTGLVRRPPFHRPHHTSTDIALVGGGSADRPRIGLVTKAHAGVLFLDEAAEFSAGVLDTLRQSLETRTVSVARSGFHVELPARFQLVLATNPCPCGRALDTTGRPCTCSSVQRRRYLSRLEGPLLDRVDVRVTLQRPTPAELASAPGESSASAAARVAGARERAASRLTGTPWAVNGDVPPREVRQRWPISASMQEALEVASGARESLRGLDLCLRLAWTLADLRGVDRAEAEDLHRAMELRDATQWMA